MFARAKRSRNCAPTYKFISAYTDGGDNNGTNRYVDGKMRFAGARLRLRVCRPSRDSAERTRIIRAKTSLYLCGYYRSSLFRGAAVAAAVDPARTESVSGRDVDNEGTSERATIPVKNVSRYAYIVC